MSTTPGNGSGFVTIDDATLELINQLPSATLSGHLRKQNISNAVIGGLDSLHPEMRLLGRARTLRYLPFRDDLATDLGMGVQRAMLETLRPGDVIVIDARGEGATGVIGDISAQRAVKLGITGIVTDGPIRDSSVIASFGVPVYFRGRHPNSPAQAHVPFDADIPVACGGVTVMPGDLIVGDADGVLVIPPALAQKIAEGADEQEAEERYVAARVAEGESLTGLFPMGAQWRERYERYRAEQNKS